MNTPSPSTSPGRASWWHLLAGILVLAGSLWPEAQLHAARAPNIVVLFADDLGYGDLGCYGAKRIRTPNLDRMAREGVRFTSFYAAQAVCSASRAALLTGCYPNRIGIHGALGPGARHGLAAGEVTLGALLQSRGYATAAYGKWHLGHHAEFLPLRHGFDEYFGLPYSNDMWPFHPEAAKGLYPALPLIEGERTIATNPDQSQLTRWYTDRALQFIARHKERPFLLYVAYNMPHVPLFASDRFRGHSKGGVYGDVVEEIDASVGEMLAALRREGLDRDTLVMFSSDNGPWLSYGNHAGSTGKLREGKGTVWEGGVRVPFVARWPGRIPQGHLCDEPAMLIDVLPTVARLAGASLPGHAIDGLDIWPLLEGRRGARSPHDALYFYYEQNELQAVRCGPWKLMLPHSSRTLAGRPGGTNGIPAKYESEVVPLSLFNLATDPGERQDVAAAEPAVVRRLLELAEHAREELGDSLRGQQGRGIRQPGRLAAPTTGP